MPLVFLFGLLVALATSCGGESAAKRGASPNAQRTVITIDAGIPAFAVATADAGTLAPRVAPVDTGTMPPPQISSHRRTLNEQVEALLGDDLVRAKQLCSGRSTQTMEDCIDAALQARSDELDAKMQRNVRALQLLQRIGNAACSKLTSATAEKQQACVLETMNRQLVELKANCPAQPEAVHHECLMEAVIRHFGP